MAAPARINKTLQDVTGGARMGGLTDRWCVQSPGLFRAPQCALDPARSVAAASSLPVASLSIPVSSLFLCFFFSFLLLLYVNGLKKKQPQSQHAGSGTFSHVSPASRRCSPPLPLCAHQTHRGADADAARPIRKPRTPPPLPNSIPQPPCWGEAPLGPQAPNS